MTIGAPLSVAIINTAIETIELMRQVFEDEGFRVSGGTDSLVPQFKRGKSDLRAFLDREQPDVVVWDIALPYAENWRYFQEQADADVFAGRGVVLTTTNKQALDSMVGPTPTIEVVGKPFDIDALTNAVRQASPRR